VLLQPAALPFCYDKFTPDYLLPDWSFGNLASGTYNTSHASVNLLTGGMGGRRGVGRWLVLALGGVMGGMLMLA
jgi:hypothetical protein